MKCQNCAERATLHITEVEDDGYQEVHLCYKCAKDYLHDADENVQAMTGSMPVASSVPAPIVNREPCPSCGMTFEQFKTTGRLGCPSDYRVFRDDLLPMLENIHGNLRHIGKVPRRLPVNTQLQSQLLQLRQELQQAISVEDYERAARLRDQIESLSKRS